MKKLNVFFEEKLIGTLLRDEELMHSFSYSDEWLNGNNAFQLSLVMPLEREPLSKLFKSALSNFH